MNYFARYFKKRWADNSDFFLLFSQSSAAHKSQASPSPEPTAALSLKANYPQTADLYGDVAFVVVRDETQPLPVNARFSL